MAAKKTLPDRVKLKNLDSLFGIDQEQTGLVLEVPIGEQFPFQNSFLQRTASHGHYRISINPQSPTCLSADSGR